MNPSTAFGNSMFDSTRYPFSVNFAGDVYQVINNELLVQYDGTDVVGSYQYRTDSLLMQNLAGSK